MNVGTSHTQSQPQWSGKKIWESPNSLAYILWEPLTLFPNFVSIHWAYVKWNLWSAGGLQEKSSDHPSQREPWITGCRHFSLDQRRRPTEPRCHSAKKSCQSTLDVPYNGFSHSVVTQEYIMCLLVVQSRVVNQRGGCSFVKIQITDDAGLAKCGQLDVSWTGNLGTNINRDFTETHYAAVIYP